MWFGTCAGGKRRVQGVCPPYDWCIPKLAGLAFTQRGLLTSPNWVDGLDAVDNAVYPTLDPGIKPFLLPALRRDKSSACASSFVRNAAMSYHAWAELFRVCSSVQDRMRISSRATASGDSCRLRQDCSHWIRSKRRPLVTGKTIGGDRQQPAERSPGDLFHEQAREWSKGFCHGAYPAGVCGRSFRDDAASSSGCACQFPKVLEAPVLDLEPAGSVQAVASGRGRFVGSFGDSFGTGGHSQSEALARSPLTDPGSFGAGRSSAEQDKACWQTPSLEPGTQSTRVNRWPLTGRACGFLSLFSVGLSGRVVDSPCGLIPRPTCSIKCCHAC